MAKKSASIGSIDKLREFAGKHGVTVAVKEKTKVKEADVSTAAKQKDLVLQMAKDLGYVE